MRISNGAKSPLVRRTPCGRAASRRKRFLTAFTLVELLVVISIIALLMAILMPALSRVKKQAQLTACKVTLHQWAIIWAIYCDDNDGRFCYATNLTGGGWPRGRWILALRAQYETRSDMLRCPIAVTVPPWRNTGPSTDYGGPFHTFQMGGGGLGDLQEECSYGSNCWIYNPRPTDVLAGEIQDRPVEWNWVTPNVGGGNNIPVFADTMWRGGGPFSGETGAPRLPERGAPPERDGQWADMGGLKAKGEIRHFCIDRHEERINMLFMDWSVRTVGLKELWTLKWHREFNTAGPWTSPRVMPRDWPDWMQQFKDY